MKNINVHILESGGRLKPYSTRIRKKDDEAIAVIVKKIPVSEVAIVFYDKPEGTITQPGMVVYIPYTKEVFVLSNPEFQS